MRYSCGGQCAVAAPPPQTLPAAMRQIGTIPTEAEAQRFAAYLITQGISAMAETDGAVWAIWVHDENQLDKAKEELEQFRVDPNDRKYSGAVRQADSLKRQQAQKREQAQKNVVEMRGRWGRPAVQKKPLVLVLIGLCVVVSFMTDFGKAGAQPGTFGSRAYHMLTFRDFSEAENRSGDPLTDIKKGEVWRIITPIVLHGSPMHLIFNMYWLFVIGGQVEARRGTLWLAALVLGLAVISNLVPCAMPRSFEVTPYGIGFSGVGYGLVGYVWIKSLFQPELGMFVGRFTMVIMIGWIVLGFGGFLNRFAEGGAKIDNWAHLIGFIAGIAVSYAPVFVKSLRSTSDKS